MIDGNGTGPPLVIQPATVATSGNAGLYMSTIGFVGVGGVPAGNTGQFFQVLASSTTLNGEIRNSSTTGSSAWQAQGGSGPTIRIVAEGSASASTLYGLTRASLSYLDSTNVMAMGTINANAAHVMTQSISRMAITSAGNIGFHPTITSGADATTYGGGVKVLSIGLATTEPTSAPTDSSVLLWTFGSHLKCWLPGGGSAVTLA